MCVWHFYVGLGIFHGLASKGRFLIAHGLCHQAVSAIKLEREVEEKHLEEILCLMLATHLEIVAI